MNKNIGFFTIFIGGVGLGLLLGNEYTGSYIAIIGAIFLVIASISNLSLYYYEGKDKKKEDNDLTPGSKAYDKIGELTEMAYYAPDKKKGNDKVK